jgi:hypothetical protein
MDDAGVDELEAFEGFLPGCELLENFTSALR